MPSLAPRAIHQHGTKVVGLFGDAMRRALQTLLACEGHVVAGLLGFALGDGFFVAEDEQWCMTDEYAIDVFERATCGFGVEEIYLKILDGSN